MATDEELDNLISMYSRGLLTDEEFVAAKERLRPTAQAGTPIADLFATAAAADQGDNSTPSSPPTPASTPTPIADMFAAAAADQHGQQPEQDREIHDDTGELDKFAAWYESGGLTAEEFEAAALALDPAAAQESRPSPDSRKKKSSDGPLWILVATIAIFGMALVAGSMPAADTAAAGPDLAASPSPTPSTISRAELRDVMDQAWAESDSTDKDMACGVDWGETSPGSDYYLLGLWNDTYDVLRWDPDFDSDVAQAKFDKIADGYLKKVCAGWESEREAQIKQEGKVAAEAYAATEAGCWDTYHEETADNLNTRWSSAGAAYTMQTLTNDALDACLARATE